MLAHMKKKLYLCRLFRENGLNSNTTHRKQQKTIPKKQKKLYYLP